MPKAVFFVQSQAASPEQEAEYHKWYDEKHVPQLCDIPGFVSARRLDLVGGGPRPADPSAPKHAVIFEIEADDLDAIFAEMGKRIGDGRVELTDAVATDPPPVMLLYAVRD